MDLFNTLPPEVQKFILDVATDGLANLGSEYAARPWYDLPRSGSAVRKQAALILGQLEPVYRNEQIFNRLTRLMEEDKGAQVRDAAYSGLMRLAIAPKETTSN